MMDNAFEHHEWLERDPEIVFLVARAECLQRQNEILSREVRCIRTSRLALVAKGRMATGDMSECSLAFLPEPAKHRPH